MRKLGVVVGIFCLFLVILAQRAHAFVIQGQSSSTIQVTSQVSGEGTATTHIETSVNGDDKIIDTNGSGNITVEHTDNSYSVTTSPLVTTLPGSASSTPSVTVNNFKNTSHHSFWTSIKTFFKNFFKFF